MREGFLGFDFDEGEVLVFVVTDEMSFEFGVIVEHGFDGGFFSGPGDDMMVGHDITIGADKKA